MKTKTLVVTTALMALCPLATLSSHAQGRTHPTPARAIIDVSSAIPLTLVRATNQVIDEANDVRTVTVWTDYALKPGEALSTLVQRGSDAAQTAHASLFMDWRPEQTRISSAFNWYFGGTMAPGFSAAEAEAALAQLRDNFTDRVTALAPGKPQPLFSVTNQSGTVMTGLIQLTRSAPVAGEYAEATVELARPGGVNPMAPSIDYSATLPPGYALLATANTGNAHTHTPAGPYEYHTSWFNSPMPRPARQNGYGVPPAPPLPVKPMSLEQLENQRKALQAQLQALQQQGPIAIVRGMPKQIFSVTNGSGEIFQGFLELVGPGAPAADSTANNFRTENPPPPPAAETYLHVARQQRPAIEPRVPVAGISPRVTIDAGTGLPQPVPSAPRIDPATGLPGPASSAPHIDPKTGMPETPSSAAH